MSTYLTTAEVARLGGANNDLGVPMSEVLDEAPLLARFAARSKEGTTFKFPVYTTPPTGVGFRAENQGLTKTPPAHVTRTATMAYLDACHSIDVAVCRAHEEGEAACLSQQALIYLRTALKNMESQLLYGTDSDALGFPGLAQIDSVDATASAMVVDAGGSAANTGSSVWGIRMGLDEAHVLWGNNGEISVGDTQLIEKTVSDKQFAAYFTDIGGWAGLCVGALYSLARIANLTEESTKTLDDDMISDLISLFPANKGPTVLGMNRRSLAQLQQSRTATNPTGAPAPFPQESHGVPIVITDNITSTEGILGETG